MKMVECGRRAGLILDHIHPDQMWIAQDGDHVFQSHAAGLGRVGQRSSSCTIHMPIPDGCAPESALLYYLKSDLLEL